MSTLEEAYEQEYKYKEEYPSQVPPSNKHDRFSHLATPPILGWSTKFDSVANPSHYVEGRKYEPIDVIEDWDLNFRLGNALKYIARAGRKGTKAEDLAKAVWYLQREIGKK